MFAKLSLKEKIFRLTLLLSLVLALPLTSVAQESESSALPELRECDEEDEALISNFFDEFADIWNNGSETEVTAEEAALDITEEMVMQSIDNNAQAEAHSEMLTMLDPQDPLLNEMALHEDKADSPEEKLHYEMEQMILEQAPMAELH